VAGSLEPPHGAFAWAGGLVGVFRTVVQVSVLSVLYAREHVPLRSPITFELIRDDDSWDVGQPLEELAEELLGRVLVAPPLHQDVEDVCSGQGKTDTQLSHPSELLIFIRTDIPERRVRPSAVVEHLDVSDNIVSRLLTRRIITVRRPLAF
jgi:hypothetical protein